MRQATDLERAMAQDDAAPRSARIPRWLAVAAVMAVIGAGVAFWLHRDKSRLVRIARLHAAWRQGEGEDARELRDVSARLQATGVDARETANALGEIVHDSADFEDEFYGALLLLAESADASHESRRVLGELIVDPNVPDGGRETILRALRRMETNRARCELIPVLVQVAADASAERGTRTESIRILGSWGGDSTEVFDFLRATAVDRLEDERIRGEALSAMSKFPLRAKEVRTMAECLVNEGNAEVARIGRYILAKEIR